MKTSFIFILTIAATYSTESGGKAYLSKTGLNYILKQIIPAIEKDFNDL